MDEHSRYRTGPMHSSAALILAALLNVAPASQRIGDPGFALDSTRVDPRFEADMVEWAAAGVTGGIPLRSTLPVRDTLNPGDDIQAAIDAASGAGGGVVLLNAGEYRLSETLYMRDSVTLRGVDPDSVTIRCLMTSPWLGWDTPMVSAIAMDGVARAGLEDITYRYNPEHTDVEPWDKEFFNSYNNPQVDTIFYNDTRGVTDLYVSSVSILNSTDCWVDNCRILESGSTTINIWRSSHITCRDNVVDRAHNKGGGQGYYSLTFSDHCLLYNEHIGRIRHLSIQELSHHNVVYQCRIDVDVNFHNRDDGHNLLEGNEIAIPYWHWWKPFQRGDPSKHEPPGPANLLYHNKVNHMNYRKGDAALDWGSAAIDASLLEALRAAPQNTLLEGVMPEGVLDTVFAVNPTFDAPTVLTYAAEAPVGGTLYAVTATNDTPVARASSTGRANAVSASFSRSGLAIQVCVNTGGSPLQFRVFDTNGRLLVSGTAAAVARNRHRITLPDGLSSGSYILRAGVAHHWQTHSFSVGF